MTFLMPSSQTIKILRHCCVNKPMAKGSDHPSKYFPSSIWKVSICQNFPPSKFNFVLAIRSVIGLAKEVLSTHIQFSKFEEAYLHL